MINKIQDPQKQLLLFIKKLLIFFIPVVLFFFIIEWAVLQIPQNYTHNAKYLKNNAKNIKLASFGSSQMQNAINPEFLDIPSINLGSTSQHHRLDFIILKQILKKLPELEVVVLELSTNHLQLPHNSKDFWKNSVYLKYFEVNAFERKTYFKDEFIFMSRPDYYQNLFLNYYVTKKDSSIYNKYGYQINNLDGIFRKLKYNDAFINENITININTKTNEKLAEYNLAFFEKIISFCEKKNIDVIITTIPMHSTFFKNNNISLTKKRDSALSKLTYKYKNVSLFLKENDTIDFNTYDFLNTNHLNSKGGEKFSRFFNEFLIKNGVGN